jgi:methyl-accepting chemotaxis protein
MKLSTRIIAGVAALCVAISAGYLTSGYLLGARLQHVFLSVAANGVVETVNAAFAASDAAFSRHARTIAREREAITALGEGRLEDFREQMFPPFTRGASRGEYTDLVFFGTDGAPVVGYPEAWAGSTPQMVAAAIETGKIQSGVVALPGGRIGYGVSFALLQGRKPVGYGLLARDVSDFLPEIAASLGAEAALFVGGRETARTEAAPPPAAFGAFFEAADAVSGLIRSEGATQLGSRAALPGAETVGGAEIVIATDITEEIAAVERTVAASVGAVLAVMAVLLAALLVWLRRELFPVRAIAEQMGRLARGEPAQTPKASGSREIVMLHDAFEVFVDRKKAQDSLAAEQAEARAAGERDARRSAALQEEIRSVMAQAAAGDFSARVAIDADHPACVEIGADVNRMLGATQETLDGLERVLARIADADLSADLEGRFEGRFAELQDSVNRMLARLRDMIGHVQRASADTQRETERIETDGAALAERIQHQAATLEETRATTEEISAATRANAATLETAQDLTESARAGTEAAGGKVRDVIGTVNRMQEHAATIRDFVSTIDGISFQTNLLALNAAVEAARAGEQGKGFAVVASEVRSLAQRSSEAAKDIGRKIGATVQSVNDGVALANGAGEALEAIRDKIAELSAAIQEAARNGRDQAANIDSLTRAIGEVDGHSQANAQAAESNAEAAARVVATARDLDGLISAFRMQAAAERAA